MDVERMSIDTTHGLPAVGSMGRLSAGRELFSFLRPFLRPVKGQVIAALALGLISLFASLYIPLRIHQILAAGEAGAHSEATEGGSVHEAISSFEAIGSIAVLVAIAVLAAMQSRKLTHEFAAEVSRDLSESVFHHTLESPVLRQRFLRRPSVISRHTSDVDRIEAAVDHTVVEGLPSLVSIALSCALLLYIEPAVGIVTTAAVLLFSVMNRVIGNSTFDRDKHRLDASSDVGAMVDEAITGGRNVTGMNLAGWMEERFHVRAEILRHATEEQRSQVNRLLTAARFTGYLALFVVVCMAVVGGSSSAAAIAPALLYIEFVVTGLERLPPWLREFRLAVTSKRRIEQITTGDSRVDRRDSQRVESGAGSLIMRDLALMPESPLAVGDISLPLGGLVVLAGDRGSSPDSLAEVLAGDRDPDSGCVLFDGLDVRYPTVRRRITLIADEPYLMDASVRDHLNSARAGLANDDIAAILERVGLGHLIDLDGGGVDAPLGTHAEVLSVHERQRLMIAMACLGDADAVVIQDLALFSDADAAGPLISALTHNRPRTILLATMNEEVAAMADHVVAIVGKELMMGNHRDLMAHEDYVQVWQRHLPGVIDERILQSFPEAQRERLRPRLFTEHFSPGDVLVRSGTRIDRVMYVVSGRVEIVGMNASGHELRVAEIGPGNFCGDISEAGGVNNQTIRAVEETTVRTLSAESWSAGLLGLLDADPAERRVLSSILRMDHPSRAELASLIDDFPAEQIDVAIDNLISLGQVRERPDGGLVVSVKRKTIRDSTGLLDRLADL